MLAFSVNNAFFHHEMQNCLVHEGKPITAAEMCISYEEVGRLWKLLFPGALCNTCSFFIQDAFVCTTKFSEIMD